MVDEFVEGKVSAVVYEVRNVLFELVVTKVDATGESAVVDDIGVFDVIYCELAALVFVITVVCLISFVVVDVTKKM